MTKLVVVIVFCVISLGNISAQRIPSTTEVVESELKGALGDVFSALGKHKRVMIDVGAHPDARWIEALAINVANEKNIEVVERGNVAPTLSVVAGNVSTMYEALLAADSVNRVITVQLEAMLTDAEGRHVIELRKRIDSVRCRRDVALATQSFQHNSTHAEFPPAPTSFWDDAVQPLIFVAAAVTTVVLLFTVRSK
ncbi:MAG: hypothetical protein HQ472_11120 [Ignavibacteria bacterium]|nr:hypothetical protein [Ignavibacteria bacterium]